MAQTPDIKTFEKGMNKDVDPRFLQPGEYIHGENITSYDSVSSRMGALTNILGNQELVSGLINPQSADEIIGMFKDDLTNDLYIFIYGDPSILTNPGGVTDAHRIVKYDLDTDTFSLVVVSSGLNFSSGGNIKAFDSVDNMLFWTDGLEEVGYFNQSVDYLDQVNIAEYSGATTYSIGDQVQYQGFPYVAIASTTGNAPSGDLTSSAYWDIDVTAVPANILRLAKPVPFSRVEVNPYTDTSVRTNNVIGKFFQFKYRFIFADKQKSVFSPISPIAYNRNDYMPADEATLSKFENAINIKINDDGLTRFVDKIEIAAREGNTGDFVSIAELSATPLFTSGYLSWNFLNDSIYNPISLNESNEIYDDIPKTAQSLRYINNRLIFGDCKTGYDKDTTIDIDGYMIFGSKITGTPDYDFETDSGFTHPTTGNTAPARNNTPMQNQAGMEQLFLDMGYVPGVNDVIVFEGKSSTAGVIAFGEVNVRVLSGWDTEDVWNATQNQFFWIQSSYQAQIGEEVDITDYYGNTALTYKNEWFAVRVYIATYDHKAILKSGAKYGVGLQYYDENGRTNGVLYDEGNRYYIPTLGEREGVSAGSQDFTGSGSLALVLNHTAPSWAAHYSLVYSKSITSSFAVTCPINDAVTSPPSGGDRIGAGGGTVVGVRLSLESLYKNEDNYATRFGLFYDFAPGDRIRFVTKGYSGSAADEDDWVDRT